MQQVPMRPNALEVRGGVATAWRLSGLLLPVLLVLVVLAGCSVNVSPAVVDLADEVDAEEREVEAPAAASSGATEPTADAEPTPRSEPTTRPEPTPADVNSQETAPLTKAPAEEPESSPNDSVADRALPAASALEPASVVWSSTRLIESGVVTIEDSSSVQYLHELSDGTLVAVSTFEADAAVSIQLWPEGDVATAPRRVATDAPMVFGSAILDDRYLALGAIRDFDAGDAHVEIWDIKALDDGPVWRDEGIWVIDGQILDLEGPEFVLAGRRTSTELHEVAIRSIDDPGVSEFVLDGYHGFLTELQDGRVATSGVTIFDPGEPERAPVDSGAWGVYNLSELQDGRIASGWLDVWRIHDPSTGAVEEFEWPYESNIASPAAFGDDQVVVNVNGGIEVYSLDDLTEPLFTSRTPADDGSAQVYGLGLTVTDSHAVALNLSGNGMWVFDLTAPNQPAVSFKTGLVLTALRDGRIASNGDAGVMLWDPAQVTTTTDTGSPEVSYSGSLCASAIAGDQVWVGTESGAVVRWDRSIDDAEPVFASEGHEAPVIAIGGKLGDGGGEIESKIVSVAEDGTVLTRNALTGEVERSIATVQSLISAAIEDDRVVLGESDGTVSVLDLGAVEPTPTVLFEGQGTTASSVGLLPDGRVTVMHLDGLLRVFAPDAPEGEREVATWDLGRLASEHAISPAGVIAVPDSGAVVVFNPDDPNSAPVSLGLGGDTDYFPPIARSDGTVVVVRVDGLVLTADPAIDEFFAPAAAMPGRFSGRCMSGTDEGTIMYISNRQVVIADIDNIDN